jgi:hypothetical protein
MMHNARFLNHLPSLKEMGFQLEFHPWPKELTIE